MSPDPRLSEPTLETIAAHFQKEADESRATGGRIQKRIDGGYAFPGDTAAVTRYAANTTYFQMRADVISRAAVLLGGTPRSLPDDPPTVLTIEVEREDDGRCCASWVTGDRKEAGSGEYSPTIVGALANLCATLIKVDEDKSIERAACGGAASSRNGKCEAKTMSEIPRRCRTHLYVPAETAISAAKAAVEAMAADVRLTDAVILLGQAQDKVADFVDGVPSGGIASSPKPETEKETNDDVLARGDRKC